MIVVEAFAALIFCFLYSILLFAVLGIEPRALCMLDKHSILSYTPSPCFGIQKFNFAFVIHQTRYSMDYEHTIITYIRKQILLIELKYGSLL